MDTTAGVNFDQSSARRIADAVIAVEGMSGGGPDPERGRGRKLRETIFARLGAEGEGAYVGRFAWVEVYLDDAGDWQDVAEGEGRRGTADNLPAVKLAPTAAGPGDVVLLRRSAFRAAEPEGEGPPADPVPCWVVVAAPDTAVVAQLSANEEGGGQYAGLLFGHGTVTADGSAVLGMPEGLASGVACLILNTQEDGQPTHQLEPGAYVVGKMVGPSPEDPPRPVVVIDGGRCRTADPVLLPVGDGALDPSGWIRDDTPAAPAIGDTPVTLWFLTNALLNTDGTVQNLVWRSMDIDAGGHITRIYEETITPPYAGG